MKSRERAFLYALLVMTLCVNLMVLLGRTGQTAQAGPDRGFDDLGPAERLLLSGESELAVRNAEGRVAWTDDAHGRAYSIGVADVGKVLPKLMETPAYRDEREALTKSIQDEEKDWLARRETLEGQYEGISADDPKFEEARAAFGEWQSAVQQWQQEANARVNTMAIDQLKRVYAEIVAAVDVVAQKKNIDLVFRYTSTDEPLTEGISGQTMLDIRMRPLLKYPEGLDITDDVLEEMSLPLE